MLWCTFGIWNNNMWKHSRRVKCRRVRVSYIFKSLNCLFQNALGGKHMGLNGCRVIFGKLIRSKSFFCCMFYYPRCFHACDRIRCNVPFSRKLKRFLRRHRKHLFLSKASRKSFSFLTVKRWNETRSELKDFAFSVALNNLNLADDSRNFWLSFTLPNYIIALLRNEPLIPNLCKILSDFVVAWKNIRFLFASLKSLVGCLKKREMLSFFSIQEK